MRGGQQKQCKQVPLFKSFASEWLGREVGVLARGGGWIKSSFIFDITWAVSIYGTLSMDEHCSKNLVHINSLKPMPTLQ